jgi:hypothetical protein
MFYGMLEAFASVETVGVLTGNGIEYSRWLGVVDRRVLRLAPGTYSVLLDIEAWRSTTPAALVAFSFIFTTLVRICTKP